MRSRDPVGSRVMATVVGAPPRPQALFVGFEEVERSYKAMSALVAKALIVRTPGDLKRLRIADWDLAVFRGPDNELVPTSLPGHIHVFAYDGAPTSMLQHTGTTQTMYSYSGMQPSTTLHVMADDAEIPEAMRRLVKRELVPWLAKQDHRPYLYSNSRAAPHLTPLVGATFVTDADRNPIAGHYVRTRSGARADTRCLVVPHSPDRPELWLAAAIDEWKELTPSRFSDLPTWRDTADWQTPEERHLHMALDDLEREREEAVRALDQRQTDLEADLVAATAAGDQGRRRLVTESGPALVEAVVAAFEFLGFEVVDVDETRGPAEPKVEDLRLTDPDAPNWTNITEVKGYGGGAKLNDLFDLNRYAGYYLRREGDFPTARWYVANQMRNDDPTARQLLLGGADEILEGFASDGGLAIDTRHLFELLQVVDDGQATKEQVRQLLREQTGRFAL